MVQKQIDSNENNIRCNLYKNILIHSMPYKIKHKSDVLSFCTTYFHFKKLVDKGIRSTQVGTPSYQQFEVKLLYLP